MRLETKTGWKGRVTIRHWGDIWRAQPETERPAFVEDCIGYLKIDFLALCDGACPYRLSALIPPPCAAGGHLLRPLVSRACRPPSHALPRPPEPRAARNHSAWRAQASSGKHGRLAEGAPEFSDPRRQRVQLAVPGEGGDFSTRAVRQHQHRACPPEPHRITIGVQASLALGSQGSAQSCHPPKREPTLEQRERMETNRQKALAKLNAQPSHPPKKKLTQEQLERTETNRLAALGTLNGLLRSSSQIVACKE